MDDITHIPLRFFGNLKARHAYERGYPALPAADGIASSGIFIQLINNNQ